MGKKQVPKKKKKSKKKALAEGSSGPSVPAEGRDSGELLEWLRGFPVSPDLPISERSPEDSFEPNQGFDGSIHNQSDISLYNMSSADDFEDYRFGLSLASRYFLPCKYYKIQEKQLVYSEYNLTLLQQLEIWKNTDKVMPTKICSLVTTNLVKEFTRRRFLKVIRDLLAGLAELHDTHKKCGQGITMDDVVIKDGKAMFWKFKFRNLDNTNRLADYENIKVIIYSMFSYFKKNLKPLKDVKHLLKMLNSMPTGTGDEVFFSYHISVMRHGERLQFLRECSDRKHGLTGSYGTNYRNAVQMLTMKPRWPNRFRHDVNPMRYGAVTKCFTFQHTSYHVSPYMAPRVINAIMLRFIRNLSSHLRQEIDAWRIKRNENRPLVLENKDISRLISYFFEAQILEFQEKLNTQHIIGYFVGGNW